MDFYDDIAAHYDEMTCAAERAAALRDFLRHLAERYDLASVLDVACGTGAAAVALAEMGVRAVGMDLSDGMLEHARRRSREAQVDVTWIHAPMQVAARHAHGPFDAVLCLGNSIPHLLTDADLASAIGGFARLIGPEGVVAIHLLNYVRILGRRERIVSIDRRGEHEFIRFYDFPEGEGLIRFNLLEVRWAGREAEHTLHSTTLRPYTWAALREAMREGGLSHVEIFADRTFAPFDESASDAVLLVGRT